MAHNVFRSFLKKKNLKKFLVHGLHIPIFYDCSICELRNLQKRGMYYVQKVKLFCMDYKINFFE